MLFHWEGKYKYVKYFRDRPQCLVIIFLMMCVCMCVHVYSIYIRFKHALMVKCVCVCVCVCEIVRASHLSISNHLCVRERKQKAARKIYSKADCKTHHTHTNAAVSDKKSVIIFQFFWNYTCLYVCQCARVLLHLDYCGQKSELKPIWQLALRTQRRVEWC